MATWSPNWTPPSFPGQVVSANVAPSSGTPSVTYPSGTSPLPTAWTGFNPTPMLAGGNTVAQAIAALPASASSSNAPAPFMVLTMAQCMSTTNSAGQALIQPIFGFDNGGGPFANGTNYGAMGGWRLMSAIGDQYLATGDIFVPYSGQQSPPAAPPFASQVNVLFVLNDCRFCLPIPPGSWQWTGDTYKSGNSQWMSFFSVNNSMAFTLQQSPYTCVVLGSSIDNQGGQHQQAGDRVLAAVNNAYVVTILTNPQFTNTNLKSSLTPSLYLASNQNVANGTDFGTHDVTIMRSTPYANYYSCLDPGSTTLQCVFDFFDVITTTQLGQCCANSGTVNGVNCGQYNGGNGSSACGSFLLSSGPSLLSNAAFQSYVHSQPGQFDTLVSTACQQATASGQTNPICACQPGSATLDPTLPTAVQEFIQANPACYNPGCTTTGYKMANQIGQTCSLAFQQCLQNQNLSNAGQIQGTPQLSSVIACTLNNSNTTSGAGTTSTSSTTPSSSSTTTPATSSTGTTTPSTTATTPSTTSSSSLSQGEIIGIAIGGVIFLILLVAFIAYLVKKSKQQPSAAPIYYR